MSTFARIGVVLLLSLGTGCSSETPTSPTVTVPSTPASPTTSRFATKLTVKGSASRSFTATTSGVVTITLAAAGPESTVVGLGLGVPYGGIAKCSLNTALATRAGTTPQITAPVEQGDYCVAIWDTGTLVEPIDFDITIVYP